jgi:MraZ protein
MLLTGSFRRALDAKQRFAIPSQWRDLLGFPERTRLFLAPGTDGCLGIYTEQGLEGLAQKLSQHSPAAQDVRQFRRLFYSRIEGAELDKQGRMRIPPELISLTGITAEIMLVGVGEHIELWEPNAWLRFIEQTQSQFDQLAERALGCGPAKPTTAPD